MGLRGTDPGATATRGPSLALPLGIGTPGPTVTTTSAPFLPLLVAASERDELRPRNDDAPLLPAFLDLIPWKDQLRPRESGEPKSLSCGCEAELFLLPISFRARLGPEFRTSHESVYTQAPQSAPKGPAPSQATGRPNCTTQCARGWFFGAERVPSINITREMPNIGAVTHSNTVQVLHSASEPDRVLAARCH